MSVRIVWAVVSVSSHRLVMPYTTSMVAMSYVMLIVFRLLFYKYMFMLTTKK